MSARVCPMLLCFQQPTHAWLRGSGTMPSLITVALTLSLLLRAGGVNVTRCATHSHSEQKQLLGETLSLPCTHRLAWY